MTGQIIGCGHIGPGESAEGIHQGLPICTGSQIAAIDQKIAVFDLGGGTFDISILEIGDGVFEVKSTNGDTHLGGDNIDQVIIDWLLAEFKKDQGIDLSQDAMAMQRLKAAAEEAKIALSGTQEHEINLPFITADASGAKHLNLRLSRLKSE